MASLYEHIREQRMPHPADAPGGARAPRGGLVVLPDEPSGDQAPYGGPTIRWAAGARDGVAVFHITGRGPGLRQVAPVVDALLAYVRSPGVEERKALEAVVVRVVGDAPFVPFVGPLLDRLESELDDPENSIVASALPAASRKLLMETEQRDCLKLAIELVGAFGDPQDRPLLETVGLHDEFTFYAVEALAALLADPIDSWMLFAKSLSGWGKIHAVLALVDRLPEAGNRRVEVCAYLIRHGCENGVQNGYLALPIALATDLHEALDPPLVGPSASRRAPNSSLGSASLLDPEEKDGALDAELIVGAGVILTSLAEDAGGGGPSGDMSDYPHGALATERFLEAVSRPDTPGADRLDVFLAVSSFRTFMTEVVSADPERWKELGWTGELVHALSRKADRFIEPERWIVHALDRLQNGDPTERWKARAVCRVLQVPMATELELVIGADPSDIGAWYDLSAQADREGMERVVSTAPGLLRLDRIFAPGPSNSLGFGPDFPRFEVCDALASGLARFPGSGGEFLRRLLESPSVRNRHSALRAYENWPQLGPADREAIAVVASGDPDGRVREHAEKLRLEKG